VMVAHAKVSHDLRGRRDVATSDWEAPVKPGALERDLQTHRPHRQQSLGISSCIVDRMMCVCGPAQVLKILEHVLNHSLVQRAEVCARMAKRVSTREVPEIPLMNCQSKPLLSLTNNARPFVFSLIQRAKFSITPSGSSKPSVSARVNPLTARVSGTHLSEMGLSLP
jgi:hypothetical protein